MMTFIWNHMVFTWELYANANATLPDIEMRPPDFFSRMNSAELKEWIQKWTSEWIPKWIRWFRRWFSINSLHSTKCNLSSEKFEKSETNCFLVRRVGAVRRLIAGRPWMRWVETRQRGHGSFERFRFDHFNVVPFGWFVKRKRLSISVG